jgi:hypothetical protein
MHARAPTIEQDDDSGTAHGVAELGQVRVVSGARMRHQNIPG